LKGTICLTKENRAFVGQHLGDLENLETLEFLELTVRHLRRILEVSPRLLVHDLHPNYLTTQVALAQDELPTLAVQHHHAHVVSCMAEHGLEGKVLGLALDGTGYGDDGCIWGGEILVADERNYARVAHFDYVPMPGGEKAIKEPWRMVVAYLWAGFGEKVFQDEQQALQKWDRNQIGILVQMMQRQINSPLTSSCGRLFDAVAALVGLRDRIAYEGQAAICLPMPVCICASCTDSTGWSVQGECSKTFFFWRTWRTAWDHLDWKSTHPNLFRPMTAAFLWDKRWWERCI
jgi:hydrogenase maturation protein HypF